MQKLHVSVGAGFENDRRDLGGKAARALAQFDGPKYLIFECLAERTLAKQVQAADLDGQIALALSYILPCRDLCAEHHIRIISNFGGIDPRGVARGIRSALGTGVRIAAVTGDALPIEREDQESTLSRNVYLGAGGIADALSQAADIVVTGRVADPSLVVGAAMHEFGLAPDDWDALAHATLAGHLIECGTQVTGGYFADEGKPVPELAGLGPPIATLTPSHVTLSKPVGGGLLNRATVTEQLLYEMGDPFAYLTPDVTLDVSGVNIQDDGHGTVDLTGAIGKPAPETLKMLTCRHAGWMGEAEINYSGETSGARAAIARDVLETRVGRIDRRIDILQGSIDGIACARLRLAVRTPDRAHAQSAIDEIEALYLNGPAGGGGVRKTLMPMVVTEDGFVPRSSLAPPQVEIIT